MKELIAYLSSDTNKFIRYVSPTIIMIMEFLIYKFVMTGNLKFPAYFFDQDYFIAEIMLFLFSGIFLSFIYQSTQMGRLNYKTIARRHSSRKQIAKETIQKNSFATISAIWYANLNNDDSLKGASIRSQELSNNLHGSGTAFIGCLIGFLLFIMYSENSECLRNYLYPALIFLFFTLLHFIHFCKIRSDLYTFVKVVLKQSSIRGK